MLSTIHLSQSSRQKTWWFTQNNGDIILAQNIKQHITEPKSDRADDIISSMQKKKEQLALLLSDSWSYEPQATNLRENHHMVN
jgi:CBS domain containing-hemolysin-like protein